jgi:hypothetical protein
MRIAHAAGLAALIGAEALLFLATAEHHYAWSYPRWYDQAQYLGQAYRAYELARHAGYAAGAWATMTQGNAQGCLHAILALPIFAVAGPSRTAALAVNLLAFAAWQVATFLAVRRISGRYSLAWASVGLLLALHFPWSGRAGSAVDYRLDWMAACAYGVTLAIALAGRGFRSTRWAVLLGAAVGVTVLLRFLTAAYFGMVFIALIAWLLARRERWGRCARLAISGLIAVGVFGPALWRNRVAIYGYYWVDHFAGPARALHDSHLGAIASVRWILAQLATNQVGLAAAMLGLAAGVAFLVGKAPGTGVEEPPGAGPGAGRDGSWVVALSFLAAPAAVLASHPIKAEPPTSILIPGAVWVMILLWIRLARGARRGLVCAVGAGTVAAGALVFAHAEVQESDLDASAADYRGMNGLSDYLFFRSEEAGLTHPRVGVTWILEGTDAESLRILGYERHKRMLAFIATLPTGLFPTSKEIVMKALTDSHFVCLATRAAAVWPFDRQMAELLPEMRSWCEAHMRYVGRLDTAGFSLSVYEARELKPTPGGVDLASSVGAAERGPAYGAAPTPAAPVFVSPGRVLGSANGEVAFDLVAAYSPVVYHASALPEGLGLNPETGEIRGRFARPGDFSADVDATNPMGTTRGRVEFHVEDSPWYAFLDAPAAGSAGVPLEVGFGACDERGSLNYIDFTDLTARTMLGRITPPEGQGQSWVGTFGMTLKAPGPHTILARFVRYDSSAKEPYTFIDRQCVVTVGP